MVNNFIKEIPDIDYVFPWVDPTDKKWQEQYKKAKGEDVSLQDSRFRDLGFLKYTFRSIAKNMPWIRKVHFIVSSPSQVPSWLNKKTVNVVYHKDIIPKQFLPTFNSDTIEMFLPNIPDLADKIIYANDDCYTYNLTKPQDFFNVKCNRPIIRPD